MSEALTAMLCTKCKEVLSNHDDIFGTSCGHLYHFHCLRECHGQSTNCSHCESYKPCMFKMFLEFGENPLTWDDQRKTIDLHNLLQGSINKTEELEEKYKISQNAVQKLESKLKKLEDALKSKNSAVSDLEDRISELEDVNKFLSTEPNNVGHFTEQTSTNIQQEKLNHYKSQLDEEIEKNAKLCIENKKLMSILNLTNNDNVRNRFKNIYEDKKIETVADEDVAEDVLKSMENNITIQENDNQSTDQQNDQFGDDECHSVLIRNFHPKEIKQPLENIIINLAHKMNLKMSATDIKSVISIKNSKNVSLIVNFKNNILKETFFSKKDELKKIHNTKYLRFFNE